ncbi:MAG: hypothetical protein RLZZ437_1597, partial [Pseudomonadota bacterium]
MSTIVFAKKFRGFEEIAVDLN